MMRPVLNREDYMRLRDSKENIRLTQSIPTLEGDAKARAKSKLVQMNYSCLPNDDGTLRGSKRMSTTVGMDIDIATPANLSPEEASEWLTAKLEDIKEVILSKKDELGLLMFEGSATKGYHIVFRRRCELSQEDNLRWASHLLGVEYDKGAKDITRVFFTPGEKLLYLNDDLFNIEEAQGKGGGAPPNLPKGKGGGAPPNLPIGEGLVDTSSQEENTSHGEPQEAEQVYSNPSPLGRLGGALPSPSSLHAFDLCVSQAGLSADEMDLWGNHNWHSNLMAVLSVGLPKLMSKEQLFAVVGERLPNYSQTDDCRTLIEYFYEKYTADKGFMSVALREINAKAQAFENENKNGNGDDDDDSQAMKELTFGWEPPKLPKKIPRLMELLVSNYDDRFREMLLLSALPVLSAHASHFRAQYLNGRVIGPQQYVCVIGGSGSGKGNCTALYQEMVQNTLHSNDEREWEKVKANAELRDKKANAKERPPKYHPKLRLFETTSKSSILELQTNLGKNGMLLGQFSEVDGLSSASRAAYSDISVLLRKGWDMDIQRQYYMSDSTCNTYTQMSISLLMAGTVKAMLERLFSDANCEGGLMQRCIPVLVPKSKRTFRPPRQNFLNDDEKKERDALLIDLYQKDLTLGDETEILDATLTNRAIGLWFDELEERYNDGLLTEAEADLSHRCGEFMLRAAIPLIALYGKETKEIVDFCRWVGETAHYAMCRIFGYRVQKDITNANEMLAARLDDRKTVAPLLDKMPDVFSAKQLSEMRIQEGQSGNVRMLLSRYCKNGKLTKIGKGVYRKNENVTVTL